MTDDDVVTITITIDDETGRSYMTRAARVPRAEVVDVLGALTAGVAAVSARSTELLTAPADEQF